MPRDPKNTKNKNKILAYLRFPGFVAPRGGPAYKPFNFFVPPDGFFSRKRASKHQISRRYIVSNPLRSSFDMVAAPEIIAKVFEFVELNMHP